MWAQNLLNEPVNLFLNGKAAEQGTGSAITLAPGAGKRLHTNDVEHWTAEAADPATTGKQVTRSLPKFEVP